MSRRSIVPRGSSSFRKSLCRGVVEVEAGRRLGRCSWRLAQAQAVGRWVDAAGASIQANIAVGGMSRASGASVLRSRRRRKPRGIVPPPTFRQRASA